MSSLFLIFIYMLDLHLVLASIVAARKNKLNAGFINHIFFGIFFLFGILFAGLLINQLVTLYNS